MLWPPNKQQPKPVCEASAADKRSVDEELIRLIKSPILELITFRSRKKKQSKSGSSPRVTETGYVNIKIRDLMSVGFWRSRGLKDDVVSEIAAAGGILYKKQSTLRFGDIARLINHMSR